MGLLTFSINVTLDGCVDHQEGIADDETHAFFTRLMDEGGAERLHPSWASSPNSKRDSTPDHEGRPLGDSVIVAEAIS